MSTAIEVWQIKPSEKTLKRIETKLSDNGLTEPGDLEAWLTNNPEVISSDIRLIGRQVATKTGELDLLGIDSTGCVIVIELKRDKVPREALAQALDYVSDVASWDIDKISEVCQKFTGKSLEEYFTDNFNDVDLDNVVFNSTQRILLVGFFIDEALERMIEWLFGNFSVPVNAMTLKYIKTESGDELLAKTSIFNEETEKSKSVKRISTPKSDTPGEYDTDTLEKLLVEFLNGGKKNQQAIKMVLLPLCLDNKIVTRDMLKEEIVAQGFSPDLAKSYNIQAHISMQLGLSKNDFLRQIIAYEYPNHPWEKDNFKLNDKYRAIVERVSSCPDNSSVNIDGGVDA